MMCRMELHLNDFLFTSEWIELPNHDPDLSAEDNENIRTIILKAWARKMEYRFAKQIERCKTFFTCAVFESAAGNFETIDQNENYGDIPNL